MSDTREHSRWPFDMDRTRAWLSHLWIKFRKDGLLESAGLLTYTTLLSLVPLLIVAISVVSSLPGSSDWNSSIQDFLFSYFLPETVVTAGPESADSVRTVIAEKLSALATKQSSLTVTMGIFLLVTSLMLMSTIEGVLNRIWGVHTARSIPSKLVVYWSMLTMGPVLLGASLALSSYLFSQGLLSELRQQAEDVLLFGRLLPILVASLAFLLFFMIIPNRRVNWRHALLGAVVTAVMFELAKKGFGYYISNFNAYSLIYDALGAIPVFLLWIYLSWTVILLGASFTRHRWESFRYRKPGVRWPQDQEFVLLYRLLGHLWQAQCEGNAVTDEEFLMHEPAADDDQVLSLLENLRQASVAHRNQNGDWMLTRDLGDFSLSDLYGIGQFVWPHHIDGLDTDDVWNAGIARVIGENSTYVSRLSDTNLKSLYQSSRQEG